jgi:high-affinity Fe2+/Pb2+ permease
MQSKKQSSIESVTNIVVGLITSFLIQLFLYPVLGIPVTINQNITITLVFFVVSFLRSYGLRRHFNKKHSK